MRAALIKSPRPSALSPLIIGLIASCALQSTGCALADSFSDALYADSPGQNKDMPGSKSDDGLPDMRPDLKDDPCSKCAQGCLRTNTQAESVFCLKDNAKVVSSQVEDFIKRCAVTTTPTKLPPRPQINAWPSGLKADQSSILAAHYTEDGKARAYEATFDKDLDFPVDFKQIAILGTESFEIAHTSHIGGPAGGGALLLGYDSGDDKLRSLVVGVSSLIEETPQARFTRCPDAPAAVAYNLTPNKRANETKLIIAGAFVQPDNSCAFETVLWQDLTTSPTDLPRNPITDKIPQGPVTLSKTTGSLQLIVSYLSDKETTPRIYNFALGEDAKVAGLGAQVTVLGYTITTTGVNSCQLVKQGDAKLELPAKQLYPALLTQNIGNPPVFISSFKLTQGPGVQTLIGDLQNNSPQRRCLFDNQAPKRESIAVDVFRTTTQQDANALLLLHTKEPSSPTFDVAELININSVKGSQPDPDELLSLRLGLEGYTFEPLKIYATPDQNKFSILGFITKAQERQLIALRINDKGALFCQEPL